MLLPPFTYHVTVRWPDGDVLAAEHSLDRERAFDHAADAILQDGCDVRVEMVQRNPETGGAIGISDVTALMLWERGITNEPEPCPDCGRDACICDEAYEGWVADRQIAAE
ncbi:hypothetical protein ACFSDD_11190 [Salipiger marinus]|uniref:hypothetical protein n=1 Tax=Salipiger marinus TaxID=555512 RepID=UPI001E2C224C|nr:hypothetical protein [Salipiger manganoxidans]MCD1619165.1 hypothetical protein [Salipiger manganoxidans]MEB3419936.1 hypothetical protein [Salipiger manganoxidans]